MKRLVYFFFPFIFLFGAASAVSAAGIFSPAEQALYAAYTLDDIGVQKEIFPPSLWRQDEEAWRAATGEDKPYLLIFYHAGFSAWELAACDEQVKFEKTSSTVPGGYRFKTAGGSNKTSGCDFWRAADSDTGDNYPNYPITWNSVTHNTNLYAATEGIEDLAQWLPNGGQGCWTYTRMPTIYQANYTISAINEFITEANGNADISSYCEIWQPSFTASFIVELPVDEFVLINKADVITDIENALVGTVFEPLTPVITAIVGIIIDFVNFVASFMYSIIDWLINEIILPGEGFFDSQVQNLQDQLDLKFPGLGNLFDPFEELLDNVSDVPDPITIDILGIFDNFRLTQEINLRRGFFGKPKLREAISDN